MNRSFLIPCRIERGGFSTERLFTIDLPDAPDETYAGYFEHFLDGNKQQLGLDVPAPGEMIHGFAKCRIIQRQDDGTIIVDIPSSDSLLLNSEELLET